MKKGLIRALSLVISVVMCAALVACGSSEKFEYLGVTDYIINSDEVLRLNAETSQDSLDALEVGGLVTIGTYNLDGNTENSTENITWKVLAIENGKALVVSEVCIDARAYDVLNVTTEDTTEETTEGTTEETTANNAEKITWETSNIRAWLAETFYANAFDDTEKEYILLSDVENDDNSVHDVDAGNDTQDYVFLLSFDEAEQYFADDAARVAKASATAVANGGQCFDSRTKSEAASAPESAEDYMAISWWLRTPGSTDMKASTVHYFGEVNPMGARVDLAVRGVRPAMWVKTTNEVLPEQVYTTSDWSAVKAGDKVSFGTYEQDGDTSTAEAITWQVLKVENGTATLISEKILDKVLYCDFEYSTAANAGATNWLDSNLRVWLKDTFINAFSTEEQGYMTTVTNKNPAHGLTGAGGCDDSDDMIYVLSSDDVKALMPNALDRRAEATDYAVANGVYVDAQTGCSDWWLRDSGETSNQAKNIYYYGGIDSEGKLVKSDYVGVRPVITVDITK